MHKRILFPALLSGTICLTVATTAVFAESDAGSLDAKIDFSEPFLLMPFSIVKGAKKTTFEISYASRSGSMLVNGKVNGTPLRFVVDTGATFVVISPDIAERAGVEIDESRTVRLQTANGIIRAPLVTLESVIADDIEFHDVEAVVHNATSDPDVGLLGMSYFGQHKITINHSSNTIVLEPK